MALEKRVRPYETLIRHHPDGAIGAHHQTITEIVDDGVVIQGIINDPVSLAVGDAGDGGLTAILGADTMLALGRAAALQVELDRLNEQNLALNEQCESLAQQVEQLQSELAAQQAMNSEPVDQEHEPEAGAE